MNDTTNIYVICPAGVVTGGTELLHQLVDRLRNSEKNAYIVYCGRDGNHCRIPEEYQKYNIKIADTIVDDMKNILIMPEVRLDLLKIHINIQRIVWWLSVDNFYYGSIPFLNLMDIIKYNVRLGLSVFVKRCAKIIVRRKNEFRNNISLKYIKKQHIIHAYQSVYAQHFLIRHGFNMIIPLTDYINTDFILNSNTLNRENIVVYNPQKGVKITKKVIKYNPDINFVPIQNMKREQVVELLHRAKVYIDFGNHPGKDRLPREAVLSGCIVITGNNGSARFFEDVPLVPPYKIGRNAKPDKIGLVILDSLKNYHVRQGDMYYFIRQVTEEKRKFDNEASLLFAKVPPPPPP